MHANAQVPKSADRRKDMSRAPQLRFDESSVELDIVASDDGPLETTANIARHFSEGRGLEHVRRTDPVDVLCGLCRGITT